MSHAHAPVFVACRRGAAALVACLAALLTLQVVQAPAAAAATPSMYQGPAFPNVSGTAPTEDKPQSKLWFNDGSWWALMRTNVNGADGNPDITVHKLEGNHTWTNTGTVVDGRAGSSGDALWEGGSLYVASRVTSGDIRAVKLSYDTNTDRYSVVFSKSIPGGAIESVTIARDSKARLWVTFTKPKSGSTTLDEVWVAHSTTNETTWTAPFRIPGVDSEVRADDISAIVAFGGKIGVMWSDQQSSLVRFAVHQDSATSDTTGWTFQTPITGTRSTDDHLNLKSLVEDDSGQVYAAIKTSRGDSTTDPQSDPSVRVLHRSASGTWTSGTAATVAEGLTRPQIALDTTNRLVYVVMSTEGGGSVYYKTAPFGASPKFTPATGTGPTMLAWSGALINNATLAKAPISAGSGLIVLASDEKNTRRYYHAELPLEGGSPGDTTAPTVSSTSPAAGATGVAVAGNVTATFSEPMDPASISGTTFTLQNGATAVPASVTYDATNRIATLNPTADLANSTTYTATVTTGVKDVAGNAMTTARTWTFTTAAAGGGTDTTPPTVTATSPSSGATAVAVAGNVTATFSEAMDATTISGTTFTLQNGATAVPAAVTYDATNRIATLNPTADLANSTTYTATVTTGVKDVAGNAMTTARTWTFTTAAAAGGGETVTLTAIADTYVSSGATGSNFGTAAALVTDGSPIEITYMKFDLSAYAGRTVTAATLQVRSAASGSTGKQNVKLVGVDTWTETGLTYSNRPALGTAVGIIGPTVINTNYNITLTASSLQGELGQVLSLGMDSTSTDGLDLNSRETTTPPKLVLTLAP